jgi:peptidyl-prolyl cis-trans isomerase SurA
MQLVRIAGFASVLLVLPLAAAAPPGPAAPPPAGRAAPDISTIVAVVNGDVVSRGDVEARARLFALSAGLAGSRDVVDRLGAQVTRALIDEKLRLQEMQRRKIVVSDKDIAEAIGSIEKRNNMAPGALRARMTAAGVDFRTMIDQVRVQIGWSRVLRDQLGAMLEPTPADLAEQERLLKAQTGQPEYHVGEIFLPVTNPSQDAEVHGFADTIIGQLRGAAPFAVVAAQFSQSQTALEGGDLGWVQAIQLDPEVARVVAQMPEGAIANPIRVPGGYMIVSLIGKRQIGSDIATMLTVREAYLPFTSKLDPQAPTDQQKQTLIRAKEISSTVHTCEQMEAANKAAGDVRPSDPGDVRLEGVNPPQFRAMLAALQDGKPSQPLVSVEGISVVIVCKRETKNIGVASKQEIAARVINERADLASRQLLRDLQRRAAIDLRTGGA